MHFLDVIKNLNLDHVDIFFDMDGVIACYDIGKPYGFLDKRPLVSNIDTIYEISKLDNVSVYILSICRTDSQIDEKNKWLDKFAPFFMKDNRNILSKETFPNTSSKDLKANFLKNFNKSNVILVDDDNEILHYVHSVCPNIILFQDSELID